MNATEHEDIPSPKQSCLLCERKPSKRGLCTTHYEQYRRKRDLLSSEAATAWETELVTAGKLLPNRQGNRASEDAFAEDFEKFLENNPSAKVSPSYTESPTVASVQKKLDSKGAAANKRGKIIERKSTKKK